MDLELLIRTSGFAILFLRRRRCGRSRRHVACSPSGEDRAGRAISAFSWSTYWRCASSSRPRRRAPHKLANQLGV